MEEGDSLLFEPACPTATSTRVPARPRCSGSRRLRRTDNSARATRLHSVRWGTTRTTAAARTGSAACSSRTVRSRAGPRAAHGTVAKRVVDATAGRSPGSTEGAGPRRDPAAGGHPRGRDRRRAAGRWDLTRARWSRREPAPAVRLGSAPGLPTRTTATAISPVVRFMRCRGTSSVHESRPETTRAAGGVSTLLDLEGLSAEYGIPSSLALRGEVDATVCRNTRAEIVGSRGVKR